MSKNGQVVRVGVVNNDGRLCSSIWRIWMHRFDLYVAVRSLSGRFKTSLHKSGKFRHAFVTEEESEKFRGAGGDRAVHKWDRPSEQIAGGTLLFQVIIPEAGLAVYRPTYKLPKGLISLSRPFRDHVIYISAVETAAGVTTAGPRFADRPTTVLASWPIPDGRTLWLVSHDAIITNENLQVLRHIEELLEQSAQVGKLKEALDNDASELRGFFLMNSADGVGRVLDLSVDFHRPS